MTEQENSFEGGEHVDAEAFFNDGDAVQLQVTTTTGASERSSLKDSVKFPENEENESEEVVKKLKTEKQ